MAILPLRRCALLSAFLAICERLLADTIPGSRRELLQAEQAAKWTLFRYTMNGQGYSVPNLK